MIQIGNTTLDTSDPLVMMALIGAAILFVIVILLIMALRAAGQSARATAPLAQQMGLSRSACAGLGAGAGRAARLDPDRV